MKQMNKKILNLYKEAKELQDAAIGAPFEEGIQIRRLSKEKMKKYEFMKGLKAASDKLEKEENGKENK